MIDSVHSNCIIYRRYEKMKKKETYEFIIKSNTPSKEAINNFAKGLIVLYNDKTEADKEKDVV